MGLGDECQPGGAIGSGVAWAVVPREHATHDIFVDVNAEGMRDLLGDTHTAEPGVAALQLNDRRDEFWRGSFGARFAATAEGGKGQTIFPIHQGFVEPEQRCRPDEHAKFWNPVGIHEQGGQRDQDAIKRSQIRRSLSGSTTNQKLMFEEKRFRGDGAYTTWAEQLRERDEQVDGQDEQISHGANRNIATVPRKTAAHRRIRSY